MYLSVFIPISHPSQPCSAPGRAKLSSSSVLPPGTVGLCWPWTGGSSLGFPGTVYLSF